MIISPEDGNATSVIIFKIVDFPAPFLPNKATDSPWCISKDTLSTALFTLWGILLKNTALNLFLSFLNNL